MCSIESESTDLNFALNTMALSEESIPKLYPSSTPLSNGNDRNPTVIQATSTPPPPPPPALPDISTSTPIETLGIIKDLLDLKVKKKKKIPIMVTTIMMIIIKMMGKQYKRHHLQIN